jgi:hypothetical protein
MLYCALVSSCRFFVVTYCIHTAYMHARYILHTCYILHWQHERNKSASCTDCRKAPLLFLGVLTRIPRCSYEEIEVFL